MQTRKAARLSGCLATLAALLLFAAPAQSASISYLLGYSNALPDGPNYLRVTVSDDGLASPNRIYFTVDILDPLLNIAGANFGIQRFAFNTTEDPVAVWYRIGGLPTGWKVTLSSNVSEFGVFELSPAGGGQTRQSPTLSFYIDSSAFANDTIYSYVQYANCKNGYAPDDPLPFTCTPTGGPAYFAAHVAGFSYTGGINSAFFAGDRPEMQVVPVPAAAWMFGSALGLLGWIRRRSS